MPDGEILMAAKKGITRNMFLGYPQLLRVWNGRPSRVWLLGSNMVKSTRYDLNGFANNIILDLYASTYLISRGDLD